MQNLIHGLGLLGSPAAIAYVFVGALIGMFVGVIPGLSTAVILSIILVFVGHLDLTATLCLFLGAHCGSFYSASVSAILLNTPPHPEAFPITFDGYPMARKGQPGRALGLSACSTFIGGLIGCAILIGFLQFINDFPGIFHPPEYVALVTLAMMLVGTLGTNSVLKAIISAGAGLLLASIGSSVNPTYRYTFGSIGLESGISIVALALGVFAIPQMVMVFGTGATSARQDMTGQEIEASAPVDVSRGYGRELVGGVIETFRHWGVLIQSGVVGGLTGIIPGIGGFTGNILAYGVAKQTSKKREQYGTGIAEGIIAPEGSSLAKEAGHMIPIIGLGIPGGVAGALFLAALQSKGVKVGYGFQSAYPNVTGEIVWIIALSGLIGTVAGVLIGPQIAKVTRVPGPLILPVIFALCISGAFVANVQFFPVVEVLVFGLFGLALRRLRYPLGSFILGLVLGSTFEVNIYLTRNIYPGLTFLSKRPLADGIFALALVALIAKAVELHKGSQKSKADLAKEISLASSESMRARAIHEQRLRLAPYPLLAPIMSTFLLGVSLFALIYGGMHYDFATFLMPGIAGSCVALPLLFLLPRDILRYSLYRKDSVKIRMNLNQSEHQVPGYGRAALGNGRFMPSSPDLIDPNPDGAVSTDIREKSWGPHGQYRRELIAIAWLFGLVGLCWSVGFPIGSAVFAAAYGLTCTSRYFRKFHFRLLYSSLVCFVIWLITYEMFHLTHVVFLPRLTF